MRVLARELASRAITVDSVLPGAVRTDAPAAAEVGQVDRSPRRSRWAESANPPISRAFSYSRRTGGSPGIPRGLLGPTGAAMRCERCSDPTPRPGDGAR
ncbi:hypothetical protein [Nocardia sienata]|uniref:hypothetical protein n=1 Tax=Nocardia sienata TaxID=248552 RepID=UPI001FDF4940|nr:hypothetical protein [Nocardia sienata]